MIRHLIPTLFSLVATSCAAQTSPLPSPGAIPNRLAFDFNNGPTWKAAASYASGRKIKTAFSHQPVGSYNVAGSDKQSGAYRLTMDSSGAISAKAGLVSGPIAVKTGETNLGKLTLAFTLSASMARPVTIKIASYNASGKRSGGLETTIYPAAPDFLQRYALDLNTFKPSGAGKFSPSDSHVQFGFEIGTAWPTGNHEIRVDDVNFSGPAFYVSSTGNDQSDGKTEKTAFATPQRALDVAQAGDIILLMSGTYRGELKPVANFPRAGSPAAWIVLKNYPGHRPTISSNGWNAVSVAKGSKEAPDATTILAYLEVRGLHVRGEGDVVREKYPDAIGKSDGRTNTNGMAVDGRYMKNVPHHIRFADNIAEYNPGQGIGSLEGDWISIENNIARFNSWTTMYGTSGISVMGASNFDAADNIYKNLIRNNTVYRNETFVEWGAVKRISDGNGIILDVNQKTESRPGGAFLGRTLVQNNLCYDNGGSGIHTVRANRIDIIGNTAYLNSASKALQYSQIYTYESEDVRIINNILVAPVADLAAGEKPEPVNKLGGKNSNVVFKNNLYFGGNVPPTLGEGDQIGDPSFVQPSRDPKVADFRLKAGSPALNAGRNEPFAPFLDLKGQPRGAKPTVGALQR